jgi:hypothetical protein
MKRAGLAGIAAAALAAVCLPQQASAEPSAAASANVVGQTAADQAADAVAAATPGRYAGVAVTESGAVEISIAGDGSLPQTAKDRIAAASAPVTYRKVANSEARLNDITADLAHDQKRWYRQGVKPTSWGPDYATNKVRIVLEHYTAAGAEKLIDAYGGPSLVHVEKKSEPAGTRYRTRDDDRTPWRGGGRIMNIDEDFASCTSGFTMVAPSGARFVSTAGHCGDAGDRFDNGKVGDSTRIGDMSHNELRHRGPTDAGLIPGYGSGRIWVGDTDTEDTRRVVARAAFDPVGGLVCFNGAETGQVCNVEITRVNQCHGAPDLLTCGLVDVWGHSGSPATKGDSGGPVETPLPGGTTNARGLIVGGPENQPRSGWYTPIRTVERVFGVQVLRG